MLFVRTTDLVQRLQVARREPALEAAIQKLDRFDLLILDDFAYVSKDQAETSVLFGGPPTAGVTVRILLLECRSESRARVSTCAHS